MPLDAKLISQTIPDLEEYYPGHQFTKEWTFKNTGSWQWPTGVRLVDTEGDNFWKQETILKKPVTENEEVTFFTVFEAPLEPGNYISYFRLSSEGALFGPKVWCHIVVKQKEQQLPQLPAIAKIEEKPVDVIIEPVEDEKPIVEEVKVEVVEPVPDLTESQIAKNTYMQETSKTDRVQDYLSLYEFGFTDFLVNQHLLEKYNELNTVANLLMNGQVSDEEVHQIYQMAQARNK